MKNPDYITKEYFGRTLDETLDKRFSEFEERLDKKFDQKFDDFAALIAKGFSDVYKRFDEQSLELYETEARLKNEIGEVREEVSLINEHLGRMEVRFSHLDEIVTQDHRPRIKNLELAVGI